MRPASNNKQQDGSTDMGDLRTSNASAPSPAVVDRGVLFAITCHCTLAANFRLTCGSYWVLGLCVARRKPKQQLHIGRETVVGTHKIQRSRL